MFAYRNLTLVFTQCWQVILSWLDTEKNLIENRDVDEGVNSMYLYELSAYLCGIILMLCKFKGNIHRSGSATHLYRTPHPSQVTNPSAINITVNSRKEIIEESRGGQSILHPTPIGHTASEGFGN